MNNNTSLHTDVVITTEVIFGYRYSVGKKYPHYLLPDLTVEQVSGAVETPLDSGGRGRLSLEAGEVNFGETQA